MQILWNGACWLLVKTEQPRLGITCNICEISVVKNDEYDEVKSEDKIDGFLFSKFYCEIEPIESLHGTSLYIAQIGYILNRR